MKRARRFSLALFWAPAVAGLKTAFEPVIIDPADVACQRDVGDIDGDNDLTAVQDGDSTLQVFQSPHLGLRRFVN